MKNDIREIKLILLEISMLLIDGGYPDWGKSFVIFTEEIETNLDGVKNKLLKLYGGMGSFNDIVLYKNNKPLINENNKLDALRTQLYNLIRV